MKIILQNVNKNLFDSGCGSKLKAITFGAAKSFLSFRLIYLRRLLVAGRTAHLITVCVLFKERDVLS